jgi:hypothetical protein
MERKDYCLQMMLRLVSWQHRRIWEAASVVRVRSSQKLFTEDEVSRLTGICLDHLHALALNKHLGKLARVAEAAGAEAEKWLFTNSDLMILTVLQPRCQH